MTGQEINSPKQAPTPPDYPLVEIRVIRGYRFFTRLTPLLLIAVVGSVAFESTLPPTINNNLIPHLDKIAHFFTFGLIAWLTASTICHLTSRVSHLTAATASLLLAVLLGLANEYIQSFTPGRFSELNDVLADMLGAIAFLSLWWSLKRIHASSSLADKTIVYPEESKI